MEKLQNQIRNRSGSRQTAISMQGSKTKPSVLKRDRCKNLLSLYILKLFTLRLYNSSNKRGSTVSSISTCTILRNDSVATTGQCAIFMYATIKISTIFLAKTNDKTNFTTSRTLKLPLRLARLVVQIILDIKFNPMKMF